MNNGIRQLVMTFYERLWNAWEDTAVDAVLAPEFTFRGSLGQSTIGQDGWRAYRDEIRRGAPDFTNDVVELVTNRGKAAARLLYTGTHAGPLLGIPATGRSFTYAGAAFFTADSGRLTDAWVLGDLDSLRRQLS